MFSKSSKYWVLAYYPATFKSCSALGLTLQLVAYGGKSLAWNPIRLYSGSLLDQLRNECILICILREWQEICLFKVMMDLSWNAGTHIHTDAGLCPLFLTILKLNTVPQAGTELVWATFSLLPFIRKTPVGGSTNISYFYSMMVIVFCTRSRSM